MTRWLNDSLIFMTTSMSLSQRRYNVTRDTKSTRNVTERVVRVNQDLRRLCSHILVYIHYTYIHTYIHTLKLRKEGSNGLQESDRNSRHGFTPTHNIHTYEYEEIEGETWIHTHKLQYTYIYICMYMKYDEWRETERVRPHAS